VAEEVEEVAEAKASKEALASVPACCVGETTPRRVELRLDEALIRRALAGFSTFRCSDIFSRFPKSHAHKARKIGETDNS
jgi:hypothetical protein